MKHFTRRNGEVVERRKEDFGIVDQKGRAVGASIVFTRYDVVDTSGGSWWAALDDWKSDVCYSCRVMPTRNGQNFGASQQEHCFLDLVGASRKALELVAKSRKRYEHKLRAIPANIEADARAAVADITEADAARAQGEAESDAFAEGIAVEENRERALETFIDEAGKIVLAWKFNKVKGDDAVRAIAAEIGKLSVRTDRRKKLSATDAIGILDGSSHGIFGVERAREIAQAFGLDPEKIVPQRFVDSSSEHKGVDLKGKAEGEAGEGVDGIDLARTIAGSLGLETSLPFYGRGSNMTALVERIAGHFAPAPAKV